jgi:hypothetical protein
LAAEKAAAEAAAVQSAEKAAAEAATAQAAVAETPAPAAAPATPAPAPAAAPKYAIGTEGPGGGIVFAASGGKYKEITKPENAGSAYDPPPAGWRFPTMPELKQVYDVLRTKLNFGDYWYRSNTVDHTAMLSPGQSEYDRIRALFPDMQFILAKGYGPPSYDIVRFTDGKTTYVEDQSPVFRNDDDTLVEVESTVRALYVRDF